MEAARPNKLFLVADGPKDSADKVLCDAARSVVENVSWQCEVHRNYSDSNLGMPSRLPSGLDWVFTMVARAIILEDDCVPSRSFFPFCDKLLERFRDDERVMEITGSNFQMGRRRTPYSYFFSRYYGNWGWATWRRAWEHYDAGMSAWPGLRDSSFLRQILSDNIERRYWSRQFEDLYTGKQQTWDWQWLLTLWLHRGLSIVPEINLVTNIGFAQDTKDPVAFQARHDIAELRHPPDVVANPVADRMTFRVLEYERGQGVIPRLLRITRRLFATA